MEALSRVTRRSVGRQTVKFEHIVDELSHADFL